MAGINNISPAQFGNIGAVVNQASQNFGPRSTGAGSNAGLFQMGQKVGQGVGKMAGSMKNMGGSAEGGEGPTPTAPGSGPVVSGSMASEGAATTGPSLSGVITDLAPLAEAV